MPLVIDPEHWFFDVSDEWAAAWLRCARGIASLVGALTLLSAPFVWMSQVDDRGWHAVLMFTSGLAYVALARRREAVQATALFCALTILIALTASSGPLVITLAELVVFVLGFRGAVALSRGTATVAPQKSASLDFKTAPGMNLSSPDVNTSIASSHARRRPFAEFWAGVQQREVIDVIVGLLTIGVGVRVFQFAAAINPEGDMIGGGLALVLIGFVIVGIGALLEITAFALYWSKAWAPLLRHTAYLALSAVVLAYVAIRWGMR